MGKKLAYEELEKKLKQVESEFKKCRDDHKKLIGKYSKGLRDSKVKFENLMNTVPVGIAISTPGAKGTVTEVNSTILKLFGYSSKEEYLKIPAFVHYYNSKDRDVFSKLLKQGPVTNLETRFKRKDGTVFWGSVSSVTRTNKDGNTEFINVFEDITKRRHFQEALKKSEQDLFITLKSIGDGVIGTDTTGRVVRMNPMAEKLTGWSLHEAKKHHINRIFNIINSKTRNQVENPVDRVLREGKVVGLANHTILIARDGTEYQIADSGAPIIDEDGSIHGVVLTFRDETGKYLTREKLQESEIWMRNMFNSLKDAVLVVSPERILVNINTAAIKMFGYSKDEIAKLSTEILHVDHGYYMEFGRRIKEAFDKDESAGFEFKAKRKNGEIFPTEHTVSLLKNDKGQPIGIVSVVRDITERKYAEMRYQTIIQTAIDGFWINDTQGKLRDVNNALCRMLGYQRDELLKMHISDFEAKEIPGEIISRVQSVINRGYDRFESQHQCKDGTIIDVELNIQYMDYKDGMFIVFVRDITEQKRIEAQLQQSQKMESIGVLAGGVAHDFNNILSIIIGNADLALMDTGMDDSLREEIEEIKKAGTKGAGLTRQLLAFSRKQIIQPRILDLNKLLEDTEKMLARLISEDIEIIKISGHALWQVEIDPGQMGQVIMNLIINARDAMPMGGKLTIETANVDLDENYYHMHGIKEQSGSYVMLAVSDTGTGMDKKTQERIFEPFYTTKERAKGTGLGLSTIYGIVKQNNGFIWVYSEPGQGASFKVYLPRAKRDAALEEKEQSSVKERGGSETILIVEDDHALRKLTGVMLMRNGYTVIKAENGEDALRKSREYEGRIDLMITDVIMPKMGGKQAAELLHPIRPQMKILYMSGYTDNAIAHHGVLAPGVNFLQKPFSSKDLLRKVRNVIKL